MESAHVTADGVEVTGFPELAQRYHVSSVPKTVVGENHEFVGAGPEIHAAETRAGRGGRSRRPDRLSQSDFARRPQPRDLHRRLPRPHGAGHDAGARLRRARVPGLAGRPAVPAAGDAARLDRAGLPVRLRVRGRAPAGAALLHRQHPPREAAALRPGRGLCDPPPVLLRVEDRALRHPRREGGAVRLRRPAGHRGHAARGAGPAMDLWPALGSGGGHPRRDRPGGRPRRLGFGGGTPSSRCRWARTWT